MIKIYRWPKAYGVREGGQCWMVSPRYAKYAMQVYRAYRKNGYGQRQARDEALLSALWCEFGEN